MREFRWTSAAACALLGLACLAGSTARAQDADANDALIEMISNLIAEPDPGMRALAFEQIREEVPGEAATKKFTELLPKLAPDVQAGLLEALGDRGDATAKPAVLEMLKSGEGTVRAAAIQALGTLGTAADVPLLAGKAAEGAPSETTAARQSLIRLRGNDVNAALVAAMGDAALNVQAELLGVLAARNAKEALPEVLQAAEHEDASVRMAAIRALRFLADDEDTAALVKIVKAADDDSERAKAALTLLATCSRGRAACAEAIIAGLDDADAASRIVLLRAIARAGGDKALDTVVARLQDDDETVRNEAVRILAGWPDAAAVPALLAVAKAEDNLRGQVLAIRGLARLAGPQKDAPADLPTLTEAMGLAKRPQEKRLLLSTLGGVATGESLALVVPALDDPDVSEEAALAAVVIAETMKEGDKDQIKAAVQKTLEVAKTPFVRDRAEKVLGSL
ncbi:MAG: HEAT repeat domain-containing protein [Pirellulales bacterium]|nr:HEAT repeat domain-containing protein [Pirellulales bacterium]